MKKLLTILLSLMLILGIFTACGNGSNSGGEIINNTLSFSQANSIEEMQKLDGQTVNIIGYMSTLSPITGNFMYLHWQSHFVDFHCRENTYQTVLPAFRRRVQENRQSVFFRSWSGNGL